MIRAITADASTVPAGSPLERRLRLALEADMRAGRAPAPTHGKEPWNGYKGMLRAAGLRPTRQRMMLGWILFAKGHRHVTADMIFEEAHAAGVPVSLATVYNTLHQFSDAGLIRPVSVNGAKAYFDTNPSEHHHFFIPGEDVLVDIPPTDVSVAHLPPIPDGFEVGRVEVVVRLRKTS